MEGVFTAFELVDGREYAIAALRKLYEHLEPGGVVAIDHRPDHQLMSAHWRDGKKHDLPAPWPPKDLGIVCSDGTMLHMRDRVADVDPLENAFVHEVMMEEEERNGEPITIETHRMRVQLYTKN